MPDFMNWTQVLAPYLRPLSHHFQAGVAANRQQGDLNRKFTENQRQFDTRLGENRRQFDVRSPYWSTRQKALELQNRKAEEEWQVYKKLTGAGDGSDLPPDGVTVPSPAQTFGQRQGIDPAEGMKLFSKFTPEQAMSGYFGWQQAPESKPQYGWVNVPTGNGGYVQRYVELTPGTESAIIPKDSGTGKGDTLFKQLEPLYDSYEHWLNEADAAARQVDQVMPNPQMEQIVLQHYARAYEMAKHYIAMGGNPQRLSLKYLDEKKAADYLAAAQGNPEIARLLAIADRYIAPPWTPTPYQHHRPDQAR